MKQMSSLEISIKNSKELLEYFREKLTKEEIEKWEKDIENSLYILELWNEA